MPTKPHRFTPGALSQEEREAAEALADSLPPPGPALVHALAEGFAPVVRELEEERLREAGVTIPE